MNRNTFVPLITLSGIMSFLEVLLSHKTSLEKYLHAINAAIIYCIMLLSQARDGISTFWGILIVIFIHRSKIEKKYIYSVALYRIRSVLCLCYGAWRGSDFRYTGISIW